MLLLIRGCIPRAWIWVRAPIICGWFPHCPAIIVSTYSCHAHVILVGTLASFGNHHFNKLFHVPSGILHSYFSSVRHFWIICLIPSCSFFWDIRRIDIYVLLVYQWELLYISIGGYYWQYSISVQQWLSLQMAMKLYSPKQICIGKMSEEDFS